MPAAGENVDKKFDFLFFCPNLDFSVFFLVGGLFFWFAMRPGLDVKIFIFSDILIFFPDFFRKKNFARLFQNFPDRCEP